MPGRRTIGTVITDKQLLVQVEASFDQAYRLINCYTDPDIRRRNKIITAVYDAFKVPRRERTLLESTHVGLGEMWHLFTASHNAICIRENQLNRGVQVFLGKEKQHLCRIIGYTSNNSLRIRVLGSPELKQRVRVADPSEIRRKKPLQPIIIPSSREVFEKHFLAELAGV